jgi:hypothetical protein
MQNSGLPEAGDAVFTFPAATLADPAGYAQAAGLASSDHVYAGNEDAARRRRDLAVEGFTELRDGGREALDDFYRAAVRLKAGSFRDWKQRWQDGTMAAALRTGEHLERLHSGDWSHLRDADIRLLPPPSTPLLGMCCRLDVYDPATGASPHNSRS